MFLPSRKWFWLLVVAVAPCFFTTIRSGARRGPSIYAVQPPELVVQTGHSSKVAGVAFSPDQSTRLLASASIDHSIGLWDLTNGRQLRRLTGHSNWVNCVAFSPDGKLLASGSSDKSIKLWDVATGKEIRTLTPHEDPVESIAFSADGRWLASGSSDKTARLWDLANGSFKTLSGHSDWVTSVAFSPDGKWLATGSRDKTILIWDLNSGQSPRSPLRGHADRIKALAFSPDGQWLASGSFDGTVRIWKTSTGKTVKTLPGSVGKIIAVAFVDGGSKIVSSSSRNVMSIWDTATGRLLRSSGDKSNPDFVEASTFAPDGRSLALGVGSAVETYDIESWQKTRTLNSRAAGFYSVAVSANGSWLAAGGEDKAVRLWDLATGRQLAPLRGHASYVTSIALSRAGNYVVSGSEDSTVRVWDTAAGQEVRTLTDHQDRIEAVTFSPDDRWLATAAYDGTIRIWETSSWQPIRNPQGHSGEITSVAFSPDGKLFASGSVDKTIRIWSTTTWAEPRVLNLNAEVKTIAFSPDNKLLAAATGDTIKFFDVEAGSEKSVLRVDSAMVQGLSFSPDGRWLASAHSDKLIRLWDLSDSSIQRVLVGHSDSVKGVAFSGDGKSLVSSGDDGSIIVWDTATGSQLATLLSLRESDDWLVVTPDGLFDGSPPAWDQILWRFGGNTFNFSPVETFFTEFFHPSLLAEVLGDNKPRAPQSISEKDRRQPTLNLNLASPAGDGGPITSRKVEIKIDLSEASSDKDHPTGSGIRDVRLFRNGSLIKVWHGDLTLNENGKAELRETVQIVTGKNVLTAYAFNRDNIKSNDYTLTLTGDEKLKRGGTIYILAVGVNEYANSQFKLRYARKDAEDFGEELRRAQSRLGKYSDIEVIPLVDSEATRVNIMLALRRLVSSDDTLPADAPPQLANIKPAQPEDLVVIYFAGHGTVKNGSFYMIPFDLGYTGSRTPLDSAGLTTILEHSISDRDLESSLEQIDAGQSLLVIDACNSGQALESEEKRRGPMNSKGLPQLAYEKGMYVLTAAQSFQVALERRSLGHGYLTYALVEEGLKTAAADLKPKDGQVALSEWFDYAVARVPQMQAGTDTQGRLLEHEAEPRNGKKQEREIQVPRVFYRAGMEGNQLIVARAEAK